MYSGKGSTSTEPAMMNQHVYTVAQNRQTKHRLYIRPFVRYVATIISPSHLQSVNSLLEATKFYALLF